MLLKHTYCSLGTTQYVKGKIDLALEYIKRANTVNSNLKQAQLYSCIFQTRLPSNRSENKNYFGNDKSNKASGTKCFDPIILTRNVEPELIATLYSMNMRQLDDTKDLDLAMALAH